MSDPAQLKALIEAERPAIVVPEIEAIATADACRNSRTPGVVRVIPTARAARLTMDREGIRRLAAETPGPADQPVPLLPIRSPSCRPPSRAIRRPGIGYPCIVKPVMSSSGKGQSKIDGPADVRHGLGPRDGRRPGEPRPRDRRGLHRLRLRDHAADGARARGADGRVETHFCEPIGHVQVQGDYVESWQPQPMPPAALQARTRDRPRGDRRPGRAGAFRRRAVRQGRPGLVQRGQSRARTTPAW